MGYNRIQTMRDNTEAIRTAFQLGVDRRLPTFEEWKVMSKYAGFGGLKCILNPADDIGDVAQWTKSDIELFAPTVAVSYTHLTLPTICSV